MKISFLLPGILVSACLARGEIRPTNLNFEDTSGEFPSGWKATGEVSPAPGLSGTFAARLASGSIIWQDFAPAPADGLVAFRFSAMLLLDGVGPLTTETSRIRLQSDGGAGNFVTLRFGPGGVDYFGNRAWHPGPRFPATLGAPFRVVVESGNLDGDAEIEYRIEIHQDGKEPVRGAILDNWNSGPNGWQGVFPKSGAGFSALSIEAGEGNTMFVDDVEILNLSRLAAAAPETAGQPAALAPIEPPVDNLLENSGFELKPATKGWFTLPTILFVAGLNGSTTALTFPYQTQGNLNQRLKRAASDFTCDFSVSVPKTDTSQSVRFDLRGMLKTIIEVRGGQNGVWEVKDGGVWKKIVPMNGQPPRPALVKDGVVRLRIIGRNIGKDDARYDMVWTDPGSQEWKHAAIGLKAFTTPASAPIDAIRFERDLLLANSFTIDDVVILPKAENAPVADHRIME